MNARSKLVFRYWRLRIPLRNMDSNDLFSFLDQPAADELLQDEDPSVEEITSSTNAATLKRKATTIPSNNGHSDTEMRDPEDEPGPSKPKRPRMASPKPIVLDDFETEAKREVVASAGLTGAAAEAGARLELRHQVSIFSDGVRTFHTLMDIIIGPASSSSSSGLQLHPDIETCTSSQA